MENTKNKEGNIWRNNGDTFSKIQLALATQEAASKISATYSNKHLFIPDKHAE